jgi:hypothetical protein
MFSTGQLVMPDGPVMVASPPPTALACHEGIAAKVIHKLTYSTTMGTPNKVWFLGKGFLQQEGIKLFSISRRAFSCNICQGEFCCTIWASDGS